MHEPPSKGSSITRPADEHEVEQFADLLCLAFAAPPAVARLTIDRAGVDQVRLAHRDGQVAGGLIRLVFGQWFGGRSVPCLGITVVAVAPWRRGSGVAREVMLHALREARDEGIAVSALYPASPALYRTLGYESAGSRYTITFPPALIESQPRCCIARPIEPSDHPAIEQMYGEWAQRQQGALDRIEFNWRRVREPRGQRARGFLLERDGVVESYVYYLPDVGKDPHQQLIKITDLATGSRAGVEGLLSFLRDHRSMVRRIVTEGSPEESWLLALPEAGYRVRLAFHWMLRVLDVRAALLARGYASSVTGTVHFEVEDRLLAQNTGRYVLHVRNGVPEVEPGGRGSVRLRERGLAALYTGFCTPQVLVDLGLIEGTAADLRVAEAVFASPRPWMRDHF
jgi:predicted acetyltransferase